MSHSETWAVSPAAANTTLLRAAAAVAGAGALTLLVNETSVQGCGYKLIFTSVGNSSGMTYTIVGNTVAQPNRKVTEVLTGPNATTGTTTNYWAYVDSITASAAATGNQSIGITGSLALPRTRIQAVYWVGAAAAGTIVVAMAVSGVTKLNVDTPATATFAQYFKTGRIPLVGPTAVDFGVVTLTQVTKCTLICG